LNPKCNEDCENCKFKDCIYEQLTLDDIIRQNEMEQEIHIERLDHSQKKRYIVVRRYQTSDKGKESLKRYNHSDKGKLRDTAYKQSDKEKQITNEYEKKRLELQWLERYERLYLGTKKNTNQRRCKARTIRNRYGIVTCNMGGRPRKLCV